MNDPHTGVIRAAIVDDEPLGRLRIRKLLEDEPDVDVVGEYRDARHAVSGILATRPGLLFLDVQMPRGSAFTILDSLRLREPPATIFVTAHREYALQAFECNAAGYLLKPFDVDQFKRSLQRARRFLGVPQEIDAASPCEALSRLAVKRGEKVYVLRIDEVDWIETAGNYVRLHIGAESHLHREPMSAFEARLDPQRFVRIHRSAIVNIDRIALLQPSFHGNHVVVLRDGTRLTLTPAHRHRLQMLTGAF